MKKDVIRKVITIIRGVKEPEKIVLFGSRVQGGAVGTSDIDIAVFGKEWSSRDLNIAKHRLEHEVCTPLKFDLLNFYELKSSRLKKNILTSGRVLYESGQDERAVC